MLRRFVSGLVWGGIVAGLGLAIMSQVAPLPSGPAQRVAEAQKAAPAEVEATAVPAEDVTADPAPVTDAPAVAPTEPAKAAPAPTVAEPDPEQAPELAPEQAPDSAPAAEPAATATEPADKPTTKAAPDDAAKDSAADEPAPAQVTADSAAPAPLAGTDPDSAANPEPVTPDTAPAPAIAKAPPTMAAGDEPLLSPNPGTAADPIPAQPAPPPAAVVEDLPRLLTPESDPGPPGKLALALPDTQPGSSSLPQIGEAPADAVAQDPVPEAAVIDDLPPIAAFARPFDNADGKPLFAILLVDDGSATLDRATLAALPFPVTFVVDPQAPNAAEAAAIYRAGLQEVVMTATGLPEGAKAADIEQSLQANAAILPETVAVIDTGPEGQLEDRDTAAAMVPILQDQGRGLITYDVGLNAADQAARRAALPTVALFRVLDADSESQPTIRRYLDRAAFKAAQEGKVVVMGSTRPETVAAILEWTVEGRAASVALAPVTAVLSAP